MCCRCGQCSGDAGLNSQLRYYGKMDFTPTLDIASLLYLLRDHTELTPPLSTGAVKPPRGCFYFVARQGDVAILTHTESRPRSC